MSEIYNIYCDESCHLENDGQGVMVLGAVWCPLSKTAAVNKRLREIRAAHGLSPNLEIKWGKVAPKMLGFYREVLEYFFENDDLHLRVLIVADKSRLQHDAFQQNHDTFYYKMYYTLLNAVLRRDAKYNIYLDIKDTRSAEKTRQLHDVLCNSQHDWDQETILRLQTVRSHEVALVQMTDLLIGAIGYANRDLQTSPAKLALVQMMRERSHSSLTQSTTLGEQKVNVFRWEAREVVRA